MAKCAYRLCGSEFTPRHARQRYCVDEHSQRARIERRPNYNPGVRPGPKPRAYTPVYVFLPAGCNPTRTHSLPIAPESTERIGGGQTYGEVVRRVWCARYERCLSHAVSKNWGGFGCQDCDVDESVPPLPGENKKGGNWSW